MPNKYSHALVLSYYEAHGLTEFPNHYSPLSSKHKHRRTRKAICPSGIYSFGANTDSPAVPVTTPPERVPSLVSSGSPIRSLRTTPSTTSIITEIYAPAHHDSPLLESVASVDSVISSRSLEEYTPRTSISLAKPLVSSGKCGRCGFLSTDLQTHQAATALSYQSSSPSIRRMKDSGDCWITESSDPMCSESWDREMSLQETNLSNLSEPSAGDSDEDNFFCTEDFSSFLWEDTKYIDSISHFQSDPQNSRRSSSIDAAVPPPIATHREIQPPTPNKPDRSSLRGLMTSIKKKTFLDTENELIG